jgi:hypothetical protein
MLDLARIRLDELAQALEDHSDDHSWWLDPQTGELVLWSDYSEQEGELDPEARELHPIDPLSSHEGYQEMEEFIQQVRDPRARDTLLRAIAGRGAFRRFKDTLLDFPDLREAWFRSHDARLEERAVRWLVEEQLIDADAGERALVSRLRPELPGLGRPFDPQKIAADVARDLHQLYGQRLKGIVLFGSWARGDAHPDSDIDLLVLLDPGGSVWEELRRMDSVLWRHSFDNDTVVTALPVDQRDFEEPTRPVLVRAQAEGLRLL